MVESVALEFGRRSIWAALCDARQKFGGGKEILEDAEHKPLTYDLILTGAFALGDKIARISTLKERIAILLPSSNGVVVTFFALHATGRVPVMLNFTSGIANIRAAIALAGVTTVLSSRRFIDLARLSDLAAAIEETTQIIWLEDVRASISLIDKLAAAVKARFPMPFTYKAGPSDPGAILFTSGSFGAPKGVVLTQGNLVANVEQVDKHIGLKQDWKIFNPLPTFHGFGLTGGVLFPLLTGLKVIQHPSPLHYKQIPALIRRSGAQVLFATDTFMTQYARAASDGDFDSLKYVVGGAERVREETHALFADKFGVAVLEGYGVTEASPVVAVNQMEHNVHGTVGRLLPGIEARLEPIEGLSEGGRLFIRGPNIFSGYLGSETDPDHHAPDGGWYDTGDVVKLDAENRVTILGRAKRFAKIGGEMVSLAAIEALASALWPDDRHAVVAVGDAKKGERLVLISDRQNADLSAFGAYARAQGAPEIATPRKLVVAPEIPVLGTGKTDYAQLQKIAEAHIAKAA